MTARLARGAAACGRQLFPVVALAVLASTPVSWSAVAAVRLAGPEAVATELEPGFRFDVTSDGRYVAYGAGAEVHLKDLSNGSDVALPVRPRDDAAAAGDMRFSPDGKRLAVAFGSTVHRPSEILVYDRGKKASERVFFSRADWTAAEALFESYAWLAEWADNDRLLFAEMRRQATECTLVLLELSTKWSAAVARMPYAERVLVDRWARPRMNECSAIYGEIDGKLSVIRKLDPVGEPPYAAVAAKHVFPGPIVLVPRRGEVLVVVPDVSAGRVRVGLASRERLDWLGEAKIGLLEGAPTTVRYAADTGELFLSGATRIHRFRLTGLTAPPPTSP